MAWAWERDLVEVLPRFPKPRPHRRVARRHYLALVRSILRQPFRAAVRSTAGGNCTTAQFSGDNTDSISAHSRIDRTQISNQMHVPETTVVAKDGVVATAHRNQPRC